MTFKIVSPVAAWSVDIGQVDSGRVVSNGTTKPSVPLGTIVQGYDPIYGAGEFIFLAGVASTVVGSLVTYTADQSGVPTFQTVLAAATAGQATPVAVATAAILAGQYGWYQIEGAAIVRTNGTLATASAVYSAGSGTVTSTQANGAQILGARSIGATGTPATNQAVVQLNRPRLQGQVV